jgi:non-heme chloroperoxidase
MEIGAGYGMRSMLFLGFLPLLLLCWAVLWPLAKSPAPLTALDFDTLRQAAPIAMQSVKMRDGVDVPIRALSGPQGAPLIVMIHGSAWHGMQFEGFAANLPADIVIPDLRGHGVAPLRRGDVDYIGQLEDDIADLIQARAKAGQKVTLLGHSSGGGLVIRFAGGAHRDLIDAAILLSPMIHHAAPTTRRNSGDWTTVLLRRRIGLSILNRFEITAANHLPVIRFAMPQAVLDGPLGATTEYSYRLNTSFAPRDDYGADIAALPPFLLLVGAQDQAFVAKAYAPLMQPLTDKGQYQIIPDAGHLALVDHPQTAQTISQWVKNVV